MAFNFLGTYSEREIKGLLDFAYAQLPDVEDRITYLRSQIEGAGWITYTFDENDDSRPVSYQINPSSSELAKYVKAYQFYGGDILDLYIRSRGEWLYFSKGTPDFEGEFQGGQVVGKALPPDYNAPNRHQADGVEAVVTGKVKDWIRPAILAKREEWEYRIKRTVDKVDQYLNEIILLAQRKSGSETLDDLREKIEYYLESDSFIGAGRKGTTQF